VKEHAKAASIYNDVVILYACGDTSSQNRNLFRMIEAEHDGIRTYGVMYGGVIISFWRKLSGKNTQGSNLARSFVETSTKNEVLRITQSIFGKSLYLCSLFIGFRSLLKKGWKPDIIHSHVSTSSLPAVLLGTCYGIPIIVTEHWSGFPKRILTFIEKIKARYVLKRAKMILPVSNFLKESMEAYGIKGEFRIVPNPINMDIFNLSTKVVHNDKSKKKILLVTSLLIPQKGLSILLYALKTISQKRSDFILNIIGAKVKGYNYEELVQTLRLENVVKFQGYATSQEVAVWMQNCDFFVQPSLMETFGVVYIEAMACGKPVVGADLPVLREIVSKDSGVLVAPGDVESLENGIEYMLDNFQNYSSQKIANYIKCKFDYETVGNMLNSAYRDTLGMNNIAN